MGSYHNSNWYNRHPEVPRPERPRSPTEPDPPGVHERLVVIFARLRKHFFILIGLPGLGFLDWIKEYARGKAMELIVEKLGPFGPWLISYRLAFVTCGVIIVGIWVLSAFLLESRRKKHTVLVNEHGEPYLIRQFTLNSGVLVGLTIAVMVGIIAYGAYVYSQTVPLLSKYPLGYVIFEADYVTDAVTPLEVRRGLRNFKFNFRNAGVAANGDSTLTVHLPDVADESTCEGGHKCSFGILGTVQGPMQVGYLGGVAITTDKEGVAADAEVLAINGSDITVLVGFTGHKAHGPFKRG